MWSGLLGLGRGGDADFDCAFGSGFAVADGAVDGAVVGAGQGAALGGLSVAGERRRGRRDRGRG